MTSARSERYGLIAIFQWFDVVITAPIIAAMEQIVPQSLLDWWSKWLVLIELFESVKVGSHFY